MYKWLHVCVVCYSVLLCLFFCSYILTLAVETYDCWGAEARLHLSRLASRLATRLNCSKSHATSALYGRLNLVLVRANARALLHMVSALTSQLNYRLSHSCSVIVVVYFVCAHLRSSNSIVHYLLWCCVQSMFSIIE